MSHLTASQGCEGWIQEPKVEKGLLDHKAPSPHNMVSLRAASRFSASCWPSHCPWEQHCPSGGRFPCLKRGRAEITRDGVGFRTLLKFCCQRAVIFQSSWHRRSHLTHSHCDASPGPVLWGQEAESAGTAARGIFLEGPRHGDSLQWLNSTSDW